MRHEGSVKEGLVVEDRPRPRSKKTIRVLVVCQARLWLESLRRVVAMSCAGDARVTVLDWARDFDTAKAAVEVHRPDVLICELPVAGLSSSLRLLELRRTIPDLGFILVVDPKVPYSDLGTLCRGKGVSLVTVDASLGHITYSLPLVVRGFSLVSPSLVNTVFASEGDAPAMLSADQPSLSPKELSVLELLAQGFKESAIADRLDIRPRTVQAYIAKARDKLGAADRTQAVAIAVAMRLIRVPQLTAGSEKRIGLFSTKAEIPHTREESLPRPRPQLNGVYDNGVVLRVSERVS